MNKTKLSLEKGDNGLMYVVRGGQRRIASITEIELCDDLRTLRAERDGLKRRVAELEAEVSRLRERIAALGDAPMTPAIREEVRWFAVEMERKLRQNDWRGGWADSHPDWLLYRLREETRELDAAVQAGHPNKIIDEAADVANFAMMIADQQRKMTRRIKWTR